jgi:hypothetical protein
LNIAKGLKTQQSFWVESLTSFVFSQALTNKEVSNAKKKRKKTRFYVVVATAKKVGAKKMSFEPTWKKANKTLRSFEVKTKETT